MNLRAWVWISAALLASFPALAADAHPALPFPPGGKPLVVTSFLPAQSIALNIAGDRAQVTSLSGVAGGAHDAQLTPQDMRQIGKARLILVNGLGLESWLAPALRGLPSDHQPKVVRIGESPGIVPLKSKVGDGWNPHVWLDPRYMIAAVSNVVEAFCEIDPAYAETYRQHGVAYVERLNRLDESIAKQLAPVKGRGFATLHDAFPYLVRRYDLSLVGVIEEVAEVEPSAKHLSELHHAIRETKARAVFSEKGSSSRLASQIAADVRLRTGELDALEVGDPNPKAYEEGMLANAKALLEGLK